MLIVFNILVLGLVGLIAYWWANQGVFSALMHLICVIAAGAIALAVWEPLTVGLLLRGGQADDYMWGVALVGVFVLSLLLLRVACDKLAPANVNFPSWANYIFGGAFGLCSGVLTMGIFILGAGFLQSSTSILDFYGTARTENAKIEKVNSLIVPVHSLTANFYAMLSNGAFAPIGSRSMWTLYPDLDRQAASLQRDSYNEGRGKTTLAPDAASISGAFVCKGMTPNQFGVLVDFSRPAFDMPDSVLTVSKAQVQLLSDTSGWRKPSVAYPFKWAQKTASGGTIQYLYDDNTHYAQNVPGNEQALILFVFDGSELRDRLPKYVRIKGTRYRLPQLNELSLAQWNALLADLRDPKATPVYVDPAAPKIAARDIDISNGIEPVSVNSNEIAPMKHQDFELTEGEGKFGKGGVSTSRKLRIRGVFQPEGTKIVKVNVSRKRSSIDIYGDSNDAMKSLSDKARPYLLDDQNGQYTPIGYIWVRPEDVIIKLDRINGIPEKGMIPSQPSAGTHELYLYFAVTKGAHIRAFMMGDTTVGIADKSID